MKHKIDPTIDCVFKALLGSEENKDLLIYFLNAVINPSAENLIASVEILNPYNEKEFLTDKLSIVDIKAKDSKDRLFQVEIQIAAYPALNKRILYNWSDIYSSQLQSGKDYKKLMPVISIWIIVETIFEESENHHHHFQVYDLKNEILLNEDCSIHILELEKFLKKDVENELERWLLFFKEGKELDDESLPEYMKTEKMRIAMNTLITFSEKERQYHLYQSRMNYIREQKTIMLDLEEALREKEAERREKEAERQEKEKERREKEKLFELVKQLQEKGGQ